MRYLIIGLGIYGSNLALDLTKMGHEVIGADNRESIVESIKDNISTAYIIDSTDAASLQMLPLKNVDIVIVAIGENFGASVRTVALLKSLGVEHIYARAIDKLHESILEGFGVDRIITPEQRAASDLVEEIELGNNVKSMKIDDDTFVIRFEAPVYFYGIRYHDLRLREDYGLTLVAVARPKEVTGILRTPTLRHEVIDIESDPTITVEKGDTLTCIGTREAWRDFCRHING